MTKVSSFPIILREMRGQSRQRSTIWVRALFALVAGLTGLTILSSTTNGPAGGLMPGEIVFSSLATIVLVACLFEGVRQTSDSLSRERRDGTLGLLLLTDLKAIDILLGKLAATSLRSFYILLAMFPILSMALPYGGVSVGDFWRAQLALVVALFLGLACGMWASASVDEAGRALTHGLLWCAALTVGPMILEFLLSRGPIPSISPAVALRLSKGANYAASPLRYWLTLVAIAQVGWLLLYLAGRRMLHRSRDIEQLGTLEELKSKLVPTNTERWAPDGEPVWNEDFANYRSATTAEERVTRALLNQDRPADWLAAWVPRHRFVASVSIYLLALGTFFGPTLNVFLGGAIRSSAYQISSLLTALLTWPLLAYVASAMLGDARRTGALELLLPTPLPVENIIAAHWRALWQQLRSALIVCCLILGIILLFSVTAILTSPRPIGVESYIFASTAVNCATRILTGLAVCRLGLLCGLRARSWAAAIGENMLWNVVCPMIATSIISVTFPLIFGSRLETLWAVTIVTSVLRITYSFWIIHWSKKYLLLNFRRLATQAE